jgi:hypothetical protein
MGKFVSPLDAIIGLTESTTKAWTKQRKAEERDRSAGANRNYRMMQSARVTLKTAAFEVMETAYNKASANGTLPANARQIYYAARPYILAETGEGALSSTYFTQTLLRNYVAETDCSSWDITWDARGHFTEPHTDITVPLGTIEVRQYLGDRPKLGSTIQVNESDSYPTHGPEHRYQSILFIEKEGFDPLLEAAHIAERFDMAIMSTKGMSVGAARLLLDRLARRGVERVFVLHDFDLAGFSILGTLGTSSRVHRFYHKIPITDIGLRGDDIGGLEAEPYHTAKNWVKVSATLRRHGATPEEIAFLQRGNRVELNAMASDEFVAFVERKFKLHGVKKLIPDDTVIERHARGLIEKRLTVKAVDRIRNQISKEAGEIALPEDLRTKVEAILAFRPAMPWDVAVAAVLDA